MNLSKKLNIEVPSYTELARVVAKALNIQKKDILAKLEPLLKDERLQLLDEFLKKMNHLKTDIKLPTLGNLSTLQQRIKYSSVWENSTALNLNLIS
ncbi:MAG: hypothetical protein Q9M43_05950 [Sulfurimonas sp.]|nr:hypothetical protein [Sulfurimonas sp.]